jgi:hypothetical protein
MSALSRFAAVAEGGSTALSLADDDALFVDCMEGTSA